MPPFGNDARTREATPGQALAVEGGARTARGRAGAAAQWLGARLSDWARRLEPSDRVTLAILSLVFATLSARLPAKPTLVGSWALHAALLAGYAAISTALAASRAGWAPLARAAAVVATMFTLYVTLAQVAFEAIPWTGDALLARLDSLLFLGPSPVLWAARGLTPARLELWSFVYAFFIPYLYASILLGLLGRPAREREDFVTGLAFTYAISFVGYLFLPARGPIVHHAAELGAQLQGGRFHRIVADSIAAMGGPHGAFPSLHVAASWYACLFDLRQRSLRGVVYLPVVALIAVATVFVRYHFVVDVLAGFAVAAAATVLGARARRRRERHGRCGPSAGPAPATEPGTWRARRGLPRRTSGCPPPSGSSGSPPATPAAGSARAAAAARSSSAASG